MGNPLGMRALESEDKSDLSSRSEQRYIDSKAKKVTQALCEYVFPAMDLDRPDDGTRYDDTAFLELQSYLGLTDTAANQGSRLFDEETTRESGGPDSDTHLHYIKQIEAMGVVSVTFGHLGETFQSSGWRSSVDGSIEEIPRRGTL
ncbi:transposase IS4 family protein [Halococcus salifodinae DSM 8989]|uniref:Transposase IS4 family protein n=1 Tax=Halococcus salifodinae DSM 8989 TaxID=1227456 RepID=M0N094_9EURY|nr:transposase IS4 family protein [Halococcus salifodinae DSM 8989]